ncbi:N-acetylmuramic acid 6-phosphate etherase [Alphaproteobacteria bacterium]|nr:N-acetylmuramic acid 6-phosphate etherase [Alphaproteobacteria bacterium]
MSKNLLKTEKILPENQWIDRLNTSDAIDLIIRNQIESVKSMGSSSFQIETAINNIVSHIENNEKARIVYVGAGTSGRLGILDCVELPPTFGWDNTQLAFMLAGGKDAMFKSSESAEDDENFILKEIKEKKINKQDVVIGISASGLTPYTVAGIKKCNALGALTIGIANNDKTPILREAQIPIFLNSNVEIVSGSTRMAAGTTQKICLNIISTMVMTRIGRVKNSLMVNMRSSNKKLNLRRERINKKININLDT